LGRLDTDPGGLGQFISAAQSIVKIFLSSPPLASSLPKVDLEASAGCREVRALADGGDIIRTHCKGAATVADDARRRSAKRRIKPTSRWRSTSGRTAKNGLISAATFDN
jgi:hypothetical protein